MTKNTEDNSPLPKDKNIDSKIAALRVLKDKISKALDAGEARALLEEYRQQVSGIPSDLLPGGLDLSKVEEACDKVIKNIQNQANALYNQESSKLVKADPEEIKVAEDIKNKISRNVKLIRDHLDNEEVKANTGLSAQILASDGFLPTQE